MAKRRVLFAARTQFSDVVLIGGEPIDKEYVTVNPECNLSPNDLMRNP